MSHPYQCLLVRHRPECSVSGVLVGASGSHLIAFNLVDGTHLCSWPPSHDVEFTKSALHKAECSLQAAAENSLEQSVQRPPAKRKASSVLAASDSSSPEIVTEGDHTAAHLQNPIIKLAGTSDGHYVVAVTGGDKCIRVFELLPNGVLHQLSERSV